MAASYSILMVRGEAEIGNSYDAQRSDGSSSVSRPRNIQIANTNGGSHQVLSQIACAFGHDSIMQRENSESSGFATIETSESEAERFILAEQVDLAEKVFHNALLCRNEAQIAYLRDPSIMTLQALEKSKTAEAVALEILDTEIRRLANTRATTVIGLKLKASYAFTDGKLADSIVGDLLQL
jgi:hypothetical protein